VIPDDHTHSVLGAEQVLAKGWIEPNRPSRGTG